MNPQMQMMGNIPPQMAAQMMPQQMMQQQFNQQRGRGGPIAGMNQMGMQMPPFNNMNVSSGGPKVKHDYNNKLCLYIGNLSQTTFDNDLFKFFKNKGYNLRNAQVMLNNDTRKSKCFGYINFYTEEECQRCLTEQNNAIINGRNIVLNEKKSNDFD